jgi:hypothetical protein
LEQIADVVFILHAQGFPVIVPESQLLRHEMESGAQAFQHYHLADVFVQGPFGLELFASQSHFLPFVHRSHPFVLKRSHFGERIRRGTQRTAAAYCIECRPSTLASVSISQEINPSQPTEVLAR